MIIFKTMVAHSFHSMIVVQNGRFWLLFVMICKSVHVKLILRDSAMPEPDFILFAQDYSFPLLIMQ